MRGGDVHPFQWLAVVPRALTDMKLLPFRNNQNRYYSDDRLPLFIILAW